jgi:excisionase family DNA binding protein
LRWVAYQCMPTSNLTTVRIDASDALKEFITWVALKNLKLVLPFYMTLEEVAEHSRFSSNTVRKAIAEGRLKASQPEGRDYRIARGDFVAWMSGSATSSPKPFIVEIPLYFPKKWVDLTPREVLKDLDALADLIPKATEGRLRDFSRLRIYLPKSVYADIRTRYVTSAGSDSILDYFLRKRELADHQVLGVGLPELRELAWVAWIPTGTELGGVAVVQYLGDDCVFRPS